MTLTAIFQLQIQMARGQQRAVEAMAQVTAQENAIALLRFALGTLVRRVGARAHHVRRTHAGADIVVFAIGDAADRCGDGQRKHPRRAKRLHRQAGSEGSQNASRLA